MISSKSTLVPWHQIHPWLLLSRLHHFLAAIAAIHIYCLDPKLFQLVTMILGMLWPSATLFGLFIQLNQYSTLDWWLPRLVLGSSHGPQAWQWTDR